MSEVFGMNIKSSKPLLVVVRLSWVDAVLYIASCTLLSRAIRFV